MAYDDGLAELLRGDLAGEPGIAERKMFGGLCFLMHGNMVCGVTKGGGMFRVGKPNTDKGLAVPGARPMNFTGRTMAGFVEADDDLMADDARRLRLMALATGFVRAMPPK